MVTYVRWLLVNRDLSSVLKIEESCFEFPWSKRDFIRVLRNKNCMGLVAEVNEVIVGYLIYECYDGYFSVLNLAVCGGFQGNGIGRGLVERLCGKLSCERRGRILVEVREGNLGAQLFLKSVGFRAIRVLWDYYDDSDEDAYLFEFKLRSPVLA